MASFVRCIGYNRMEFEGGKLVSISTVHGEFRNRFPGDPIVISAPGRINLLGEHVDYNDGLVLPTAIDKEIVFSVAPSNTRQFNCVALDYNQSFSFSVDELAPGKSWENYLMGVVQGVLNKGREIEGVDCLFSSNIPAGAGLSSSAALCCGFGYALNELYSLGLTKLELAYIAQYAEHEFAGVRCGIMDQYASLFSNKGNLLFLDCRDTKHQYIPFDLGSLELLLIDTKIKHDLSTSAYNARRAACEAGVDLLQNVNGQINALRDVSKNQLNESINLFDPEMFLQCQYVIEEIDRVNNGIACLKINDLVGFGQLMYQSHVGLKEKYKISCDELDFLVTLALGQKIIGARMMGGGFGGCTINLIESLDRGSLIAAIEEQYQARFGMSPAFYTVSPQDGVRVIS